MLGLSGVFVFTMRLVGAFSLAGKKLGAFIGETTYFQVKEPVRTPNTMVQIGHMSIILTDVVQLSKHFVHLQQPMSATAARKSRQYAAVID
jgi:hypothetical protein